MTISRDTLVIRSCRLEDIDVDNNRSHEQSSKNAVTIHPMLARSPSLYMGYNWNAQQAYGLQRQDLQKLFEEQPRDNQTLEVQPEEHPLSLFDYTCEENLRAILGYLDGTSLCAVRRACRYFYQLGDDDEYWLHLCKSEWAISPDQLRQEPESYQALYKFASLSLKRMIREYFAQHCLASMQKSLQIPNALQSYTMY